MAVEFASPSPPAIAAAEPAPLRLLFLGDRGHHLPRQRFEQLHPVMRQRGINLTYSESADDLHRDRLRDYDGLIVYANIDNITPAQEQALLDFVAGGKGFVPLHCASFCFRNSDKYVELVGAQFQKHGTGIFRSTLAEDAAAHPLTQGYSGFSSWDETYVHTRHNDRDRIILEYRVDDSGREPWTWVRSHGKGRVFYTAWGHDERTWSHPGFHNLVERGIRWACGTDLDSVPQFTDRPAMTELPTDLKPFEFVQGRIPFYPPGKQWGTTSEPVARIQKPLSASESVRHFVTPVGFHVELFASDPQIGKPLCMTWDERGRLWLGESIDYPNDLQPHGSGHDRIRICEDTDGDRIADKFTIFAENLSIPTAILCCRGGVIVQNGTHTEFLKDTNGDDKADLREVLISNWAVGDTHGGVSNFQYGLDNWIWGMQGYNLSEPVVRGEKQQSFRMGFFRFRLDASDPPRVAELEFVRSTNNNTWGLGISEEGLIFGSTANGNPSEFMPIPNRHYERVKGWSAEVLQGIAESNRFEPITENVRQVDHHGGFTAAAGHALYTARAWPAEYWNRTAFVTEPTGHLIATFVIGPNGAGFRSRNSWNILASDDEWSAPIMAEVGPDGQLWVIDWYNLIIQHNPTPAGFKTGKGNAYEIDLRDKKHGRVYRVVHGDSDAVGFRMGTSTAELVATLRSDNMFWRRQAQRLLIEQQRRDAVPALVALAGDINVDAKGLNPAVMHALWTLHGLGQLDGSNRQASEALLQALEHRSAGVRRNAVQLLPRTADALQSIAATGLLQDADPQVRLAALLTMAELPANKAAGPMIFDALASTQDRWLGDAGICAAAAHARDFLETSLSASDSGIGLLRAIPIVAEHWARTNPGPQVLELLIPMKNGAPEVVRTILGGLEKGWPRDGKLTLRDDQEAPINELFDHLPAQARAPLISLAVRWGAKSVQQRLAELSATLLGSASDDMAKEADRLIAAGQFIDLRRHDAEAAQEILSLITARSTPEFVKGILESVGKSEAPEAGTVLVRSLPRLTPSLRQSALRVLLGRSDWTIALLDALDADEAKLSDLSLDQKQALASHPTREIASRAKVTLARGGGLPNPDRQKVLAELEPLTKKIGDVAAGKEVFKKQCAKCHTHSGEGAKIGPDLTGMAVHPKHELLIHLIDPSRSVEGNFRVYTVSMLDGRVMSGLLASESRTAIELVDAEAKRHALQREEIDELRVSDKSLMPEGFEKQVTPEELVHLLEFLTHRGKFLPLPLTKSANIVTTKGMFFADEGEVERLVLNDWSPKTVEGVPFVLIDPAPDRIPNAVMLNGPHGVKAPRMPKSITLPCNATAKAIHLLSGISGWGFPAEPKGSVSMIVRLQYADGASEDHPLVNGEHFADYIRRVDVPGSKFAFAMRGQQMRYLSVVPQRAEKIESIQLVKGPDRTAPVVLAVTVESP
jgi:putative membrane-bound dehydrogenase-like protein